MLFQRHIFNTKTAEYINNFYSFKPPRDDFQHFEVKTSTSKSNSVRYITDQELNQSILFQEFLGSDTDSPISALTTISSSQNIYSATVGIGFLNIKLISKELPLKQYVQEHFRIHKLLSNKFEKNNGLKTTNIVFEEGVTGKNFNILAMEYIPGAQANRLSQYLQSSDPERRMSLQEYHTAQSLLTEALKELSAIQQAPSFLNMISKNKYFHFQYSLENFFYFNGQWYFVF